MVLLLSVTAVLVPAQSAGAGSKEDKKKADRKIAALKDDLDETYGSLVKADRRLKAVNRQMAAAQAVVDAAQKRVDAAKARFVAIAARQAQIRQRQVETEQQLAAVELDMERTSDQINALARAAYERGRLSDVAMYLQAESPQEVAMRVAYTESATDTEEALLRRLDDQRKAVEQRKAELAALQQELTALRAEALQLLADRKAAAQEALVGTAKIARLVKAARNAQALLQRAVRVEKGRIARAEAEARALQAQLYARARGGQAFSGRSSSGLIRPNSGPITSPFGMRVHPITGVYKLHDGTDFAGGCGSPIVAAASGRVFYKGFSGAWGNRVVVEDGVIRGRNVSTAYNHMTRSVVSQGQRVSQGQLIGYIGSTGYSTGCHLHFNLYVNGTPVDPMGWL